MTARLLTRLGPGMVLLGVAGALFAAILTCPRCGYEYRAGDAACSNCRNALPNPSTVPDKPSREPETEVEDPASVETPQKGEQLLRDSLIIKEIALARHMLDKEEYWTAFLLARNARALNGVSKPPVRERDRELAAVMKQAVDGLETQPLRCPVCEGTGSRTVIAVDIRGEVKEVLQPGTPCSLCNGLRAVNGLLTERMRESRYAQALRAYREIQQTKNYQKFGPLWYPGHLNPRDFSSAHLAAMRRPYGGVCPECHGVGFDACEACTGVGRIACTNQACVDGFQVCPECNGKRISEGKDDKVRKMCRTCSGKGIKECETCRGKAYLSCIKCNGGRQFPCRKCNGHGETPECSRCDGLGTSPCRKCDGKGVYRSETCPSCKGEGEDLCRTCDGFGHRENR